MNNVSFLTTYILGALHSLEPGHGKSIVALQASKDGKFMNAMLLLVSLLVTHFSLVLAISMMVYYFSDSINIDSIRYIAPFLLIGYGIILLSNSKSKKHTYMGCHCDSHDSNDTHKTLFTGFLAGLTPCPSVFAPIAMSISSDNMNEVFVYLTYYILGVVSVFVALIAFVFYIKKNANKKMQTIANKLNSHLYSGIILIAIGVYYLLSIYIH